MRFRYNDAHLDFLRAGYPRWRVPELTRRFNARFGLSVTEVALKSILSKNRIRSGRPPGFARGEIYRTWSPAMVAWLRDNRGRWQIREVTRRLNAHFDTHFTHYCVANACKKHGIDAGAGAAPRPASRRATGRIPGCPSAPSASATATCSARSPTPAIRRRTGLPCTASTGRPSTARCRPGMW